MKNIIRICNPDQTHDIPHASQLQTFHVIKILEAKISKFSHKVKIILA